MAHVDLYDALGVARDDRAVAIRHAFHDLTRTHRPAIDFVSRFLQEAAAAFVTLSDAHRRGEYDRRGDEPAPLAAAAAPGAEIYLDVLRDFDGTHPSRAEIAHAFRGNFADELPK